MAVAELLALKEQIPKETKPENIQQESKERSYTPKDRSLANSMRTIYDCFDELNEVPASGQSMSQRLATAMTDQYQRNTSKRARFRPRNPDKKKLGEPQVRKLDSKERQKIETSQAKTEA